MANVNNLVTAEHLKQFDEHGYFVLPSVISSEHLTIMKNIVENAVLKRDKYIEENINNKNLENENDGFIVCSTDGKYFFFMHEDREPELNKIIFSKYLEQIVRAVLGNNVYYTHSEIVVKRGQENRNLEAKTSFSWHQDSGYVPYQHTPYLSCWCALTEMTSNNGTISVLPIERNPPNDEIHKVNWSDKPRPSTSNVFPCYEHRKDNTSADLVGYFGNDSGIQVVCPAGSIVVFSSLTLHCSSANRSDSLRSAYNIQYASTPLMNEDNTTFRHKADPFIIDSQTVSDVKKWQE